MAFKIDFDKIVSGLTKEFVSEVPSSAKSILRDEIEKKQNESKTKQECENLETLKDDLKTVPKKTKIRPIIKIGKGSVKKLTPKDPINGATSDHDIITKIQDKESAIKSGKQPKKQKSEIKKPSTEVVSMGRRIISVDKDIFQSDYAKFLKANPLSTNEVFISDHLRGRSGKFWTIDLESKNFVFAGNNNDAQGKKLFTVDFHEIVDEDDKTDFGRTYQIISLESDVNKFVNANNHYSKDLWHSFVHGKKYNGSTKKDEKLDFTFESTIREEHPFYDHAFDMNLPFSIKEIENVHGTYGVLSADIKPNYNFFIDDYETSIQNKNVLENTLPNMYVMLSEMNSKHPNPEFARMISLDGTIQTDTKNLLSFKKKGVQTKVSRVYDLKKNPVGEYFDLFGRQYQNAVKDGAVKKINTKFSNIGISIDDLDLIKKFGEKEELFPMNVTIRVQTDKTTTFAQILKDTSLSDIFTSKIINKVSKNKFDTFVVEQATEEIVQESSENAHKKTKFTSTNHKSWDIADIIQELQDSKEPMVDNAIYLGEHDVTQKTENKSEFKFFRSLMSQIFQSKIQTLIKQKFRTYEDLISGKLAYSETILYRIAKFAGTDTSKTPILNIFVPNATNIDMLEYIDTQVKYDTKYTYIVYAYQMIVGNKYWYADLHTDSYDHHATLKAFQEPSLKLVEIPYYNFVARVIDTPPAPPDIDFIGYKGIDNKFLLLFNNSVSDLKTQPIKIKDSDEIEIQKVRESQMVGPSDPVSFGGDDRISQYEIYRLQNKPISYQDFQNALRKVVETDISKESIQKATSAGYVDVLEPNKKYYYVFRAIDVHGHISNPTALYQAEIINEHGTIFQLVNVVDFKEPFEKEVSKTMKRFIQIVPTVLQSLVDEKKSGFATAKSAEEVRNKISLSLAQEKLWGKTFRIQLVSRNTGKKISFDVTFKHQPTIKIKAE